MDIYFAQVGHEPFAVIHDDSYFDEERYIVEEYPAGTGACDVVKPIRKSVYRTEAEAKQYAQYAEKEYNTVPEILVQMRKMDENYELTKGWEKPYYLYTIINGKPERQLY